MKEKINEYLQEVQSKTLETQDEIEQFRIKFLGRQGIIKDLREEFKGVPRELKREVGMALNELKTEIEGLIETSKSGAVSAGSSQDQNIDLTRPEGGIPLGSRHPISIVRRDILDIFSRLGFTIAEGPEIEDDWHVFSGLNFPPEHPARDMQDTFFIEKDPDLMLRTHTSSVQVREMENHEPPLRIVMPGRVFRNEAISARAHCIFHQIEGLYIDKDVSFADLKQTLMYFAKEFFGEKADIRLRPSFFPFTEPSAEVDVFWGLETEVDYRITKGTGWLEILGCGMVDPNVLKSAGIDPNVYSGFAFGMGIERIAMLRHQIGDLRNFFENDARFLKQFSSAF